MKKLISIFLTLVFIIFQIDTIKVSAIQRGDYTFSVSNYAAIITGYTGSGGNVTIPMMINGFTVTSIDNNAFENCSSLTSITIPNTVETIGDCAFQRCSKLTSITIPSSVTSIGDDAFCLCSSLSSIIIPNGVSSIGEGAFCLCNSLTSITIPNSVTNIGQCIFCGCSSLTSINVAGNNTSYSSLDGVLYNKLKTTLMSYPAGKTNSTFVVPSGVSSIDGCAFYKCTSLINISIPNSVKSIGNHTFDGCSNLTNITMPNGITNIGEGAFCSCGSLTSITIPDGVTSIGDSMFLYCSKLTSITLPNSVTSIGNDAFGMCSNLTNISIPSNVTNIGYYAFGGCSSLTSITIPRNITSISDNVFFNCSSNLIIYYHSTATDFTNPWNGYETVPYNIVSYDGNGNTGGAVVDNNIYTKGTQATIINNSGNLVRTGCIYAGWNTKPDGSGIVYPAGTSVSMNGTDLTLYAEWITISPSSGTFTKTTPANLTAVITIPNKSDNSIIGIYNGTDNLVEGTDETLIPTTTGYTFTLYSSYLSKLTSNTPITLKFKDGSSLTYTVVLGATMSPSSGTFTKTAPANLTSVITAPNKTANPVIGVYNGSTRLVAGTDEAIIPTTTGYTFTLYSLYLSKLTSNTVITLKFKDGSSLTYTVILGATIPPTPGIFIKTSPTNLTAVITAPNKSKNPIIGVYNGTTKLVAGTDEAVVPNTTGYTFTLYKSYLYKLTANTVITLKFKDGSSINYTVKLN